MHIRRLRKALNSQQQVSVNRVVRVVETENLAEYLKTVTIMVVSSIPAIYISSNDHAISL